MAACKLGADKKDKEVVWRVRGYKHKQQNGVEAENLGRRFLSKFRCKAYELSHQSMPSPVPCADCDLTQLRE